MLAAEGIGPQEENRSVSGHRPTSLKLLKRAVLFGAKSAGLFSLVTNSRWRRQRLLIHAFHSVSLDEEHRWRRSLYFTPEEFRSRLQLLQRSKVSVLPLEEAVLRLHQGTLPPAAIALTFDDGQADFLEIVWPELERFGYPATVYATTYYSEKRLPIFPLMCSYVLWKARRRSLPAMPLLGVGASVELGDDTRREQAADAIVLHADRDGLTAMEKDDRIRSVADLLGVNYDELIRRRVLQIMNPDEIRDVSSRGADVELHTHRHRVPRTWDAFAHEIQENRRRIEALTGRQAVHFCYPWGVHPPELLPWLQALGVKTATTCAAGLASRADSDLALPRLVDTVALSEIEIEGWLSGFSHYLLQRRIPDEPRPMPEDSGAAKLPAPSSGDTVLIRTGDAALRSRRESRPPATPGQYP